MSGVTTGRGSRLRRRGSVPPADHSFEYYTGISGSDPGSIGVSTIPSGDSGVRVSVPGEIGVRICPARVVGAGNDAVACAGTAPTVEL